MRFYLSLSPSIRERIESCQAEAGSVHPLIPNANDVWCRETDKQTHFATTAYTPCILIIARGGAYKVDTQRREGDETAATHPAALQPQENIFAFTKTLLYEFFSSLVHLLFVGRKEIAKLKIHFSPRRQRESGKGGGGLIYLLIAAWLPRQLFSRRDI